MKFNAKEVTSAIPSGVYPASVAAVQEQASKKDGSPMFVIAFTVYSPSGNERTIKEYVPLLPEKNMLWKLKRICQATGLIAVWDKGDTDEIGAAIVGKNLRLTLEIEEDPTYGDKNIIKRYDPMSPTGTATAQSGSVEAVAKMEDSDIPF